MAKRRTITYCLLALTAILLVFALLLLSVGSTRANYENKAVWNTIVQPFMGASSNCLMEGGQTILLGEITKVTSVSFSLRSQETMAGTLSYDFPDAEHEEYLDVELTSETVSLSENDIAVELLLIPTKDIPHEEVEVDVVVMLETSKQTLEATFRMTLPEVEPPAEENGDGESGGEQQNPDSNVETGSDTENKTESNVENDVSVVAEDESANLTPAVGNSEREEPLPEETPSPDEGESTDPAQPETDSPTTSEGEPDSSTEEPPTSGGDEGDTGDTQEPEVIAPSERRVGTFKSTVPEQFSLKGALPMTLAIPLQTTRLTMNLPDDDNLPPFTRYSVDQGESWYMLYYGGEIEITSFESISVSETGMSLLLDLSYTSWDSSWPVELDCRAYTPNGWYSSLAKTSPRAMLFGTQSLDTPIMLTADWPLTFPILVSGESSQRQYTLERLSAWRELGHEVIANDTIQNDTIRIAESSDGAVVTISMGEDLPEAGTYRLTIDYSYYGASFAQSQITFFVNYSGETLMGAWEGTSNE